MDPSTSAPRVNVNIYCAKPGMVIGKGGEERIALQNKLTKEYGKTVIVNVIEVKSAATNAQLVAEDIARQLENRVTFPTFILSKGLIRKSVGCTRNKSIA